MDVVFVLHGERFRLTSGETSLLDAFMRAPNLSLRRVRGKIEEAVELGTEIVIADNEERGALRDSLDLASGDRQRFTEGMERLRRAARQPFAGDAG